MRHARRTDRNHAEVRDGIRERGHDVCDMGAVGNGVPDLCVRHPQGFYPLFLQVKDGLKPPSARRLTPMEEEWNRYCGAITRTVTSLDEALDAIEEWLG
jgi:hypothetical protein